MWDLFLGLYSAAWLLQRKTDTMATKKSKDPQVIKGSHLTVTVHPDGRRELVWDDDALVRDVNAAVEEYNLSKLKPAVKAKAATRKKKA